MQIQSSNSQDNMTKFLYTQKKTINVDDLRLDALITEGNAGEIVIVGCPFDYVRKRAISKGGQQNGPCCIRRFFYKVGPLYNSEYQINISQIQISDYGNINVTVEQLQTPEKVILKIKDEVELILKNKQFPFLFGGSKESSLGSARAFHKQYQNGKHLIMAGMPFLKRAFDNDKLTSQNLMTILSNQFPQKQVLFGSHENYFPRDWNKNFEVISYKQIYDYKQGEDQMWKLGFSKKPVKKLASIWKEDVEYHVTLSVDVIERFSGCRDLILHGMKPQEITQIFFWLGEQSNIKSIDITQFNPSCQDYQSSLILINFLYHFLMGWTKRKPISKL